MMENFKDFFYYNRRERTGVIVLLIVVISLFIFPHLYALWQPPSIQDFTTFEEDIAAFEEGLSQQKKSSKKYYNNYSKQGSKHSQQKNKKKKVVLKPTTFDPNTVSQEQLQQMQLPQYTIKSIINYRKKGGQFPHKESLQKIYTLSDEHYQQLLPYIDLPPKPEEKATQQDIPKELPKPFAFDPNTASPETLEKLGLPTRTIRSIVNYREKGGQFREASDFKKIYTLSDEHYQHLKEHVNIAAAEIAQTTEAPAKSYQNIDINTATHQDWQQFRGIGPSFARRIIKFRNALGGYIRLQQVQEVYGLPDSVFQYIRPYLVCDNPQIQKININQASLDQLKQHPYLRWSHAKAIIAYRTEKGKIDDIDYLQILEAFDDNKGTFQKIRPYLVLE